MRTLYRISLLLASGVWLLASGVCYGQDFLAPAPPPDKKGGSYHKPRASFEEAMGAFDYGDNQMAVRKFWPLAQEGDPRAQYYLAYLLDSGQGAGRDASGALSWYRRAAEQDYLPAVVYMGYAASTGRGMPRDDKAAFKWYTKGAQAGDPVAQNNIAAMLLANHPYRRDPALAAQWFLQSALQGNARAQYNLATLYRSGDGAPKNPAEAIRWYGYAANQGDMYAQLALAYMYKKGEGVEKDSSAALDWYRRAAEQGLASAQYTLARMYETGEGDPSKGPADAIIWYIHAAGKGMGKAQLRLAQIYEQGQGVPKDMREAVKWYEKAVEDNNQQAAMVALGHLYEAGGNGFKKDEKKALTWYQRAADAGFGEAQMEVGRMYRDGVGTPKNLVNAYQWFTIAANTLEGNGKSTAVLARIQVGKMLSPQQQMQARQIAARWQPVVAEKRPVKGNRAAKNETQLKYE